MRIDRLTAENFKLFEKADFVFHPEFNLVIGENGRGKTSLLRAIAVALGGWAYAYVKAKNDENRRPIEESEVRTFFLENRDHRAKEVRVEARFTVAVIDKADDLKPASKVRMWRGTDEEASKTSIGAKVDYLGNGREYGFMLLEQGSKVVSRLESGHSFTLPVIAFYECDRLWRAAEAISQEESIKATPSRFEPYKDCFHSPADHRAIAQWLIRHELASIQQGAPTPTLQVLQIAAKNALEGCMGLRFDIEASRVIVEFEDGRKVLFEHLSDGQRTLLGLFCDLARRASILNPHLGDRVLEMTSGVVLIDELDLHLHPRWQRRIIEDLRRTFPKVQFICTTHSPQLIGQAKADEILLLGQSEGHPGQSYGMDSNWILRHVMGSDDRDPVIAGKLDAIFEDIENAQFDFAQEKLNALRVEIGDHPDLVEAEALISRYTRFDRPTTE